MSDYPNKFPKDPPSSFFLIKAVYRWIRWFFYQKMMEKFDFDEKWAEDLKQNVYNYTHAYATRDRDMYWHKNHPSLRKKKYFVILKLGWFCAVFRQQMCRSSVVQIWELIRETYIFKKFEKYNSDIHWYGPRLLIMTIA